MSDRSLKLAINNHDLAEAFFEDTRLLGIMAPVKDYQFCWQLNSMLGMDFRINNDIEIRLNKKKRDYYFSVFEFKEPTGSLAHYVYKNQFDGEYLLPEFKHLDFLWLMKDDWVSDPDLQQFIQQVKSLNGVQLVAELTNERIKNKEHLVF
ncbi:IPExxxVDY family protein [Terrimonas sp. NA20]|uniref:IPExxxVDY family protein n=1 Tax=Terrimonas ginsenosidimutans TaxID=2908004 RepID=A0ABS9KKY5_9BACT|nr:IPExxxVDY family protein [Terrimonas ginsenosidimutans]MCG2612985.1 IPExxxVDY family protein [Terrimonas ginsenosidimutans]